MVADKLFSIGRAASVSGVSTKTLRYYESLGLIMPKKVSDDNGYRYYDRETLLLIPVIKYYRQIGLDLKRIKELISEASCSNHYYFLEQRKDEIKAEKEKLLVSMASVDDWMQLIIEGELCLKNQSLSYPSKKESSISLKYHPEEKHFCQIKQSFSYNFKESIINLEWIKYLEDNQLEVSDPVILKYDSYLEKMAGTIKFATIMQHCFPEEHCHYTFGGFLALSAYHIGSLETISDTYQQIVSYAKENGISLQEETYERHVIDYWVTQREEEFVTEVIIPIIKKDEIKYRS